MSSIKDLLGDMTLEEFEVKRKDAVTKLKGVALEDMGGEEYKDVKELYSCWIALEGKQLTQQWVKDRGGSITTVQLDELVLYSINEFIGWLDSLD